MGRPSVIAGSTSAAGPFAPTDGNQRSPKEKTCTSVSPTQNTGSDTASDGSASSVWRSQRARV